MGLGCGAEGSASSLPGSSSWAAVEQRSGAELCGPRRRGGGEPGRLWEEAWELGAPGTRAGLQASSRDGWAAWKPAGLREVKEGEGDWRKMWEEWLGICE